MMPLKGWLRRNYKYEVKVVSVVFPRTRVVGFSEKNSEDVLRALILKCNTNLFYEDLFISNASTVVNNS